jgi:DNA-binding MarR family transcriptional regulator
MRKTVTVDDTILTADVIRELLYRRDVALARHRAAFARALGVTDAEMLALVHLAQHGELSPSRIAALLDLSSGGTTALVQRLERAGHVTRTPHPVDRRSTLIRLSPQTAARLRDAQSPLIDGLEQTTAGLSASERAAVTAVFKHLAALSEELDTSMRLHGRRRSDRLSRPVPSLWA